MNPSETNLDIASEPSVKSLQEEVQSLRTIITGMLLVLIVLSGAVNIYLMRQASVAHAELEQAQKYVNDSIPFGIVGREFWPKAVEFGRTHPDFQTTVLQKWAPVAAAVAPAPASAPRK